MQKHVIITGGSSGIGKGIADHYYKQGWQVLITGRNTEKLEQVKVQMPGINTLEYDSLKDSEQRIINFIKDNWDSSLDILVNNAGHVELGNLKDLNLTSMQNMY